MESLNLGIYDGQITFQFMDLLSIRQSQEILTVFLKQIARESLDAGAKLIGHIKCFVETEHHCIFYGSIVSADDIPKWKGRGDVDSSKIVIKLNALVYGINSKEMELIVEKNISSLSERFGFYYFF